MTTTDEKIEAMTKSMERLLDGHAMQAHITTQPAQAAQPQIMSATINIGDILTKIATAMLVLGMGWLITSVVEVQRQQSSIMQEQGYQKEALADLKRTVSEGTRDRYPRQEALNDHADILERLLELRTRQTEGFARIEKIEQEIAILKATK